MADYSVTVNDGVSLSYNVTLDHNGSADPNLFSLDSNSTEVIVGTGAIDVAKLTDLQDVVTNNLSNTTNQYVMVYDASANAFKFVNPDRVLDAAVGVLNNDPSPVGLSTDAINYFDTALDNKIDLDGGTF